MSESRADSRYRVPVTTADRVVVRLIRAQQMRPLGRLARLALRIIGVDVLGRIGPGLLLPHSTSGGLVVNAGVVIGRDATIFHGVTLGRSDVHRPGGLTLLIEDDVLIGAGAVILGRSDRTTRIGTGAIIGANSVVCRDVPAGEVWAGNPARRVR